MKDTNIRQHTCQDQRRDATLTKTNIQISPRKGRIMPLIQPKDPLILLVSGIDCHQRTIQVPTPCPDNIMRRKQGCLGMKAISLLVGINRKKDIVAGLEGSLNNASHRL